MNEIELKINILKDIIVKKKSALIAILNITENLESVYSAREADDYSDMLNLMTKSKQENIEIVIASDNAFQKVFDEVMEPIKSNTKSYVDDLAIIQDYIKEVIELDMKIRYQEQKNRSVLASRYPVKNIERTVKTKQNLYKAYEKNKKTEKKDDL